MPSNHQDDGAGVVVPFGKHKGLTVVELLARDPQYAQWALGQAWLAQRFAEVHKALSARGAAEDGTPEHNAMQGKFLDHEFRAGCLMIARREQVKDDAQRLKDRLIRHFDSKIQGLKDALAECNSAVESGRLRLEGARLLEQENQDCNKPFSASYYEQSLSRKEKKQTEAAQELASWSSHGYLEGAAQAVPELLTTAKFEISGVDVIIEWHHRLTGSYPWVSDGGRLPIELKPSLGDDYPAVMRQMQRLHAAVLVMDEYTGAGITEQQMRKMFAANSCLVVSVREIEATMAEMRAASAA